MSSSRAIASGSAAAAASLVMMVAKGQETAGNGSRSQMNDTSRPCAGASLSAAAAAGSSFVLPLWLLRSKMPGLFPVVYAKEAANIVVSSE